MSLEELDRYRKGQAKKLTNLAQLEAILKDPAVYNRLLKLPLVERVKTWLPRSTIDSAKRIMYDASNSTGVASAKSPQKPLIHVWTPLDALLQASKARVSIEKAERDLGYRPICRFHEGMSLTESWANWANLIP